MSKRKRWPKVPEGRDVTKQEVKELLKQPGVVQDDLSYEGSYTLPDGTELIVAPQGWGAIYDRAAYAAYIEDVRQYNAEPQHVLCGMLPQGEKFPDDVPRLIDELARLYEIPRAKLNLTWESLKLVERAVRRIGAEDVVFSEELYPPLVAYLGEIIRKHKGGRWHMQLDPRDGETWEPYVLGDDGLLYNPFMILVREVDEGRAGLVSATRSELSVGGRRPEPPRRSPGINVIVKDGRTYYVFPGYPLPEGVTLPEEE